MTNAKCAILNVTDSSIFPVLCYYVAQKVNIFGKFPKLRPRDPFKLAIPGLKIKGYHGKIQIFFQRNGQFSEIFLNFRKSRNYFGKLYIQIIDFHKSHRFYPFPINELERHPEGN